ncbi:hypothetical protein [Plantibacter sp. YIM 135347]|uniref:hypothetical protein n=1 Tax=Plantibacter sp. YIM 135347 TaxID=3423919 RepID=UPI003D351BDF
MTSPRPGADDVANEERILELVDRILGLEARVAREATINSPARSAYEELERENAGLRQQLQVLHSTATWKVGRAVLAPASILKRNRS